MGNGKFPEMCPGTGAPSRRNRIENWPNPRNTSAASNEYRIGNMMLIRKSADIRNSEITPKSVYLNRRKFLAGVPAAFLAGRELLSPSRRALAGTKFPNLAKSPFSTSEPQSTLDQVTHYNNFYEFGTGKDDPAKNAHQISRPRRGASRSKGTWRSRASSTMDEILKLAPLEERIYRHRCVEAWSIVVPWVGYSLSALLKEVRAQPKAKFVAFESYYEPEADAAGPRRPGISSSLTWKACGWTKPCTRWRCSASACMARRCRNAGRRAGAHGAALEVWLQEHQVAGEDQAGGDQPATTWNMANAARIRLLFQRESQRGPSALEPGQGAPPGRVLQAIPLRCSTATGPGGAACTRAWT